MPPIAHPGRLLKREMQARNLSANRLELDIGAPSGRVTDILTGRRSVTAKTAARLSRYYFGHRPQFWLDLQSQHEIARQAGATPGRPRRDDYPHVCRPAKRIIQG